MSSLENKGCKPMICEVDTYFKSRILKAPPKMTKPELKKWCRDYALNVLKERGDMTAYNAIESAGKQDDLGDVVCYCEGWYKAMTEGIQSIRLPAVVSKVKVAPKVIEDRDEYKNLDYIPTLPELTEKPVSQMKEIELTKKKRKKKEEDVNVKNIIEEIKEEPVKKTRKKKDTKEPEENSEEVPETPSGSRKGKRKSKE